MLAFSLLFIRGRSLYVQRTADAVCFDLEVKDYQDSDDRHEDTGCTICAAEYVNGSPRYAPKCEKGIENWQERTWRGKRFADCIEMARSSFNHKNDIHITTDCTDAMWLDRLWANSVGGSTSFYGNTGSLGKMWGSNDNKGWCLSKDDNDWRDWNNDSLEQRVLDDSCYPEIKFTPDGRVYGIRGDGSPPKSLSTGRRAEVEEDAEELSAWMVEFPIPTEAIYVEDDATADTNDADTADSETTADNDVDAADSETRRIVHRLDVN